MSGIFDFLGYGSGGDGLIARLLDPAALSGLPSPQSALAGAQSVLAPGVTPSPSTSSATSMADLASAPSLAALPSGATVLRTPQRFLSGPGTTTPVAKPLFSALPPQASDPAASPYGAPPLQSALAPPASPPLQSALAPQPMPSALSGLPSMASVPYTFGQGAQGLDSIKPPPLAKPGDDDDDDTPDAPAPAAKPVSAPGLPATMGSVPGTSAAALPGVMPAASPAPQGSPGLLSTASGLLDRVGNIYGNGGGGDALINLGIGLMSGPGGLQRASQIISQQQAQKHEQDISQANLALQRQKLVKDQQSIQAGADYLQSIKPDTPRAQAEALAGNTSVMSSVASGQFKTKDEKAEQAKLVAVPLSDGRFQNQWVQPGQATGVPVGDPFSKQPLVNVDQRGESAEAAEAGKMAAERRNTLLTAADAAPDNIARLRLLQNVLSQTQTGPLAGVAGKVTAVASQLGISPDTIKGLGLDPNQAVDNEVAQKLAGELVVGSIGAKNGGFPASNFSIAERQFIEKMFPNILSQPGSNAAVTDVLVARDQRKIDMSQDWSDYKATQRQDGKIPSFEDWEGVWAKQHARDNIFQPIIDRYNAGGYTPGAPSGGAPAPAGAGTPPQIRGANDYNALPSGAQFVDPNGQLRTKR